MSTVLSNDELVELIVSKLEPMVNDLRLSFQKSNAEVGVRYFLLDNLLPKNIAEDIYETFPSAEKMRLMDSFREKKYTSKNFDQFNPMMAAVAFAFQDRRIVQVVERITGIADQTPDPSLYAGGLSAMGRGHFLGPHIDNSHEVSRKFYRTLNLLYYISPDWILENGGNLELWNSDVSRNVTIVSKFNRLVIMETNPWSWHSVSAVSVDALRCCVSNYYFSPTSPTGSDYFNVTSFSARPEQKILRVVAWADNKLRQVVRAIVPGGLGREDVYEKTKL